MSSLLKNVANQNTTFLLVSATTGGALIGATVTVYVTKDGGAQAVSAGVVTDNGNGAYNFTPTQADTNATDVGFTFTATGAIPVHYDFHTDTFSGDPLASDVPGAYTQPQAGWVLGQLVGAPISFVGPTNPITGSVTLIVGDDYLTSDSRALIFDVPYGTGNPNLTGATVTGSWYSTQASPAGIVSASVAGVVSNPGTANQTVTLQVSKTVTSSLLPGKYSLVLSAALSSGDEVTFAQIACRMMLPQGPP